MLGAQRGQDADHHHPRPLLVGPGVAMVELLANLLLVLAGAVAHEALRRDVDLQVEPAELLDERRAVDAGQHLGVAHGRVALGVDQVELDLHAGQRGLEVELLLGEHLGQDIQAAVHLVAVALPVLATECPARHVLAHKPKTAP